MTREGSWKSEDRGGVVICWYAPGVSAGRGTIQMDIFWLGNIEVITYVFFSQGQNEWSTVFGGFVSKSCQL